MGGEFHGGGDLEDGANTQTPHLESHSSPSDNSGNPPAVLGHHDGGLGQPLGDLGHPANDLGHPGSFEHPGAAAAGVNGEGHVLPVEGIAIESSGGREAMVMLLVFFVVTIFVMSFLSGRGRRRQEGDAEAKRRRMEEARRSQLDRFDEEAKAFKETEEYKRMEEEAEKRGKEVSTAKRQTVSKLTGGGGIPTELRDTGAFGSSYRPDVSKRYNDKFARKKH